VHNHSCRERRQWEGGITVMRAASIYILYKEQCPRTISMSAAIAEWAKRGTTTTSGEHSVNHEHIPE